MKVCEFCETSFNESKTDNCYKCDCGREGRIHCSSKTLREYAQEEGTSLRNIGLSKKT
jgi:hypothetical protein|tara:strand:+ start:375 stop:548 length:174 start_codon:yes stop_codon:yes gene_type:complete